MERLLEGFFFVYLLSIFGFRELIGDALRMENYRDMQIWLHKCLHIDVTMDVIGGFQSPNKWMFEMFSFVNQWHITSISNINHLKWVQIFYPNFLAPLYTSLIKNWRWGACWRGFFCVNSDFFLQKVEIDSLLVILLDIVL